MPEISFYILASESLQERYLFACKLLEKVYHNGIYAYVLTDDSNQSRHLDNLLWTFRAGSFIPHEVYTGDLPEYESLVLIGSHAAPEAWQNTVLNLSSQVPDNFQQIVRLLEIIDNSVATKTIARTRYRQYRQLGITPTTYKIEDVV